MTLLEVLQQINSDGNHAAQLTDMVIGTVTRTSPLEIVTDVAQAALRSEVLYLTEPVIEKKLPILAHFHTVEGTSTGTALSGLKVVENGRELPASGGYITINKGLSVGEKVLLLSVQHGQKFIVLSRLY